MCWFTVILHFPYRRYLTRFLPPRVIAKRFQLTIEYFSNPLLPLSLDYSILIVPPSRLTSTFPLRNFSCLEIIKIFPSPFRKFARFLSLPFPFLFSFSKEKGGRRSCGELTRNIETESRRRESCCHSPLAPLFPIMLGSLFLEQKTILRGAYLCRELRLERASQILWMNKSNWTLITGSFQPRKAKLPAF